MLKSRSGERFVWEVLQDKGHLRYLEIMYVCLPWDATKQQLLSKYRARSNIRMVT